MGNGKCENAAFVAIMSMHELDTRAEFEMSPKTTKETATRKAVRKNAGGKMGKPGCVQTLTQRKFLAWKLSQKDSNYALNEMGIHRICWQKKEKLK